MLREFDADYFRQLGVLREWDREKDNEDRIKNDISQYTHDMAAVCYGRRLFITDQGSLGLAPPRAQEGDSIVFFPGGLYPLSCDLAMMEPIL